MQCTTCWQIYALEQIFSPLSYSAYDYPANNAPPVADYNGDYGNYGPPGPGGFPDEYSDGIANCGTGEGQFPCPEKGLCSLPIDLGGQGKQNFLKLIVI